MIYYNETVSVPFSGFILQRKVNISILAGNDNITLSLIDSNAIQSDFSIPAGQKMQQRDFDLFRFTIQGSGLAAVALSYPEVIDPSIQVSLNPNVPQSITTPQLPSGLDSNGLLKTRYLSSFDLPNRSWYLGSGDSINVIRNANQNNGLSVTIGTAATPFSSSSLIVLHFQCRNTSTANTMTIGNSSVQSILLFPNSMLVWDASAGETADLSQWYVSGTENDILDVNYQT